MTPKITQSSAKSQQPDAKFILAISLPAHVSKTSTPHDLRALQAIPLSFSSSVSHKLSASHLFLLCWCEIVLDVECFADFFGRLSLDHVRHRLTRHVQQTLDVKVVCRLQRQLYSLHF